MKQLFILAHLFLLVLINRAEAETFYLQAYLHQLVTASGTPIDDVAENIRTPIGFDFQFFGKTVDHFTLTSNGVIGLRKGAIGAPGADIAMVNDYYDNVPLSQLSLTGSGQDSYNLYVFWDDLVSKDAKQHVTSLLVPHDDPSNVFGTDILTIQYSNYGFFGQTLGLGTIQVVLVSQTNEIYYNYVDLPNERSKATQATIGMTGGTEFVQTSHNSSILNRLQNIKYTPNGNNYDAVGPNPGIIYNGVLYVSSPPPGPFSLTAPAADATAQAILPTFSWSASENVATYKLVVASDINLNTIVYQNNAIDGALTSFTLPSGNTLQANQTYHWNLQAINAEGELWSVTRQFTTTQVNQPPVIQNTPATSVLQNNAYSYQTTITDPDAGDTHTFSITNKPSWATFSNTGLLSGTPANAHVGSYNNIEITVTDNNGASTSTGTFTITVVNVNDAPAISGTPVTSILEDNNYQFIPDASDVDSGDTLTFSISNKPAWATFNTANGQLSGTPINNHVGFTDNIIIAVTDGQLSDQLPAFGITVSNTNDAPSIFGQPSTQINEDNYYQFTPSAFDEDVGDSLTFSITNKPNWASFNSLTGELYGKPLNKDVGTYNNIIISANDASSSASLPVFAITVSNINDAPTISGTPSTSVNEDSSYQFTPSAYDDDIGDVLTFSITNKPSWAQFDSKTGQLFGTPTNEDVATTIDIAISVSDSIETARLPLFSLTVNNVNDKPTSEDLSITVDEDQSVTFTPIGNDVDKDSLTFEVIQQPLYGTLIHTAQQWIYTPNKDFHGLDSIIYHALDNETASDDSTITIKVNPINDAPIATDDTISMQSNALARYELDVVPNDIDVDGDLLTLASVISDIGNVSIEENKIIYRALTGTPNQINIKYSITDTEKQISMANVLLTIEDEQNNTSPILSAPADVIVNATGLLTKVDLGVATATDSEGNPIAVSLIKGNTHFKPGIHSAFWQAIDSQNRQTIVEQKITVNPLISIDKDITITEGTSHQIALHLNGKPSSYPFSVSYKISGTASSSDHALFDGEVLFNQSTTAYLTLETFEDAIAEESETVIITLDDNQNVSSNYQQTITIVEQNLPPHIDFKVTQANQQRNLIVNNNDIVNIDSHVTDLNPFDIVTLRWQANSTEIINTSEQGDVFTFNPENLLPGIYSIELIATDNADSPLTSKKTIYLEVTTELAVLTQRDSDGDLIPDNLEGFKDSDQDGVPDYLDAISECNVMQEQALQANSYLVESEPGICMRKGSTIANSKTGGIELLSNELPADMAADNLGGIFDFILEGLPKPGGSYRLVLPQINAIPANATYRKLINNQWTDFVIDEFNSIHSTAGEPGYCPTPGDSEWQEGLIEGAWCVQLTIQDGGKNDADGIVNGTIVDPSGVAVYHSDNKQPIASPDKIEINWNSNVMIDVLANDTDENDDPLILSAASADFGQVTIVDNWLYYQAAKDFYGTATIQYSISDSNGGTSSTTVLVEINANFSPIAHPDVANTDDKTAITIYVLDNDVDPENQTLSITSVSAQQGTAVINSDQSIRYTPKRGFDGIDAISYTISDGQLAATSTVSITIKAYKDVIVTNKSGGGLSALFIVLLTSIIAIRQKAKWLAVPLLLAAFINPINAFANSAPWLIALSIGQSKVETNLNTDTDNSTELKSDNTGTQTGLNLSYKFANNWAFSLGYLDLGQSTTIITSEQLEPEPYIKLMSTSMPLFTQGITLSSSYIMDVHQDWQLNYTVGTYIWQSELKSQSATKTITHTEKAVDPFLSFGISYLITPDWQTGLSVSRYFINANNTNSLSLSLGYRF
ncbi:Ig-like domain-containing protein [Pseudoalteromonas tunicata]|uniref:Ig-like domain-containing protein n=1 Tax=Pseudoalteromonas tunicata TaxID=314281 RepID=UPI00273F54FC|nr:Ig-like domain-containing protein [Pseudoalteromonas tunicata]MDP5214510.1 Ig-like domain-containing protein [Pseudoalteromonas tunicata]